MASSKRAWRTLLLSLAILGERSGGREPALHYTPEQLDCAHFRETSRGSVETYTAGRARQESVGLDGEWRFRAKPGRADSVQVEAWFDSLSVWRRTAEANLEPDTDPLIGGRYRGVVSRDGRYRADARPFVPDDIAEVADLSRALDDLLPRLPTQSLPIGGTWTDGAGLEIRRLAGSAGIDSVLQFSFTLRRDTREGALRGDSTPIRLHQTTREDGTFAWHIRGGLLRRQRHITIETEIPPEPRVQRPVRARVEQNVLLERLVGECTSASPDR
ncbi:MAG TPA: hypothetical protein VL287_17110 [Gemmatimonadales bacterium]|jgi:hypothetical protein|nr:hypothetical protein [Gemmatimonadales bacterium]